MNEFRWTIGFFGNSKLQRLVTHKKGYKKWRNAKREDYDLYALKYFEEQ